MEVVAVKARPKYQKRKRVAAYCRVSTSMEKQQHSLATQVSYYSSLIQSTPGWEYAGVFSDDGISARTSNREGFQQMLKACWEGKIDIILTKSISRFARNTVDLLETVRELKRRGIEVRFEREKINTFTADGEFLMTLLASFAQAESENLSQNIRWTIQRKFKEGEAFSRKLFGYTWENGEAEIVEEEAKVVRRAFNLYLELFSAKDVAEQLNREGLLRRNGKQHTISSVEYILNQERYTGNEILQKYYQHPQKHRRVKNTGEFPRYLVKNSIPAIIDQAVYDEVHRIMTSRKYIGGHERKGFQISCFSGKIECGICGRHFNKCYNNGDRKKAFWKCRGVIHYKDCSAKRTPEEELKMKVSEAMGTDSFDEALFREIVEKVIVKPDQSIRIIYRRDGGEVDNAGGTENAERDHTDSTN